MQTKNHYNKISYVIDRFIPQHIKDNYPLYYDFIETYYEYLQQNDFVAYNMIKNLQNWNDVDTTLDDFVENFKNEYINLPINSDDWGLYIKHYKEIYASKGNSKSLEFFIKLLTGLNVNVYYPNRYLMKSSDGIYRSYTIIYCEKLNNVDYNDYISTKIKGAVSNASGIIEKIEIYDNYVKIFLSNINGQFNNEMVIFDNGIKFQSQILNNLSDISVFNCGNNYKIDDKIEFKKLPNILTKVADIYDGSLDKIEIIDGGEGYNVGEQLIFSDEISTREYFSLPFVIINKVDENGKILDVKILNNGYGLLSTPICISVNSANGKGARFNTYSNYAGGIKKIELIKTECNLINEVDSLHQGELWYYDFKTRLYSRVDNLIFGDGTIEYNNIKIKAIYNTEEELVNNYYNHIDNDYAINLNWNNTYAALAVRRYYGTWSYVGSDTWSSEGYRMPIKIDKIYATYNDMLNDSHDDNAYVVIFNENYKDINDIIIDTDSGYGADLHAIINYQHQEIPYYYKTGSFLSDIFKLQDSYYWQEYSYVLNVAGNVLDKYKNIFKNILHPAGYIYFTNTELINYITLSKKYIDSIISTGNIMDIDKNQAQYIELLHYEDRMIHDSIIYPYRKNEIEAINKETIESKQTLGGSFIESSLDITDIKEISPQPEYTEIQSIILYENGIYESGEGISICNKVES